MKRRASNGMGSIRQRPDGRWEARYTSPDGVQRSVYAKTEAEVTRKLRSVLHDLDSGSWRSPSALTVAQWAEIWLRDYQQHNTPQTVAQYRRIITRHITPVIGSVRLVSLTTYQCRRVAGKMAENGLSARYQHLCGVVLSSMLSSAVESKLIRENPAAGIRLPKAAASEMHIIDRDMITAFLAAAQSTKYGLAAIFALYTGLRCGELCGLCWSDVDGSQLNVRRQIRQDGTTSAPKDNSARSIILTPEALDILRQQRVILAQYRLRAGGSWPETDLVFRRESGERMTASAMRYCVAQIGKAIGVPALHPHDLRHSYAVAALRSGADVKTVQHNLGHKSAAMTLDVYAAYTTDAGRVSAERLSEYLKSAINQPEKGTN